MAMSLKESVETLQRLADSMHSAVCGVKDYAATWNELNKKPNLTNMKLPSGLVERVEKAAATADRLLLFINTGTEEKP